MTLEALWNKGKKILLAHRNAGLSLLNPSKSMLFRY